MQPIEKLYSVKEATALLGLGVTSFYDRLKTGQLRALKSGRRTLIAEGEIRRFQNSLPAIGRRIEPNR